MNTLTHYINSLEFGTAPLGIVLIVIGLFGMITCTCILLKLCYGDKKNK